MIKVPLATVKDAPSGFVEKSVRDEVLITRHGKPVAVLVGFIGEGGWFDSRLDHDERWRGRGESCHILTAEPAAGKELRRRPTATTMRLFYSHD